MPTAFQNQERGSCEIPASNASMCAAICALRISLKRDRILEKTWGVLSQCVLILANHQEVGSCVCIEKHKRTSQAAPGTVRNTAPRSSPRFSRAFSLSFPSATSTRSCPLRHLTSTRRTAGRPVAHNSPPAHHLGSLRVSHVLLDAGPPSFRLRPGHPPSRRCCSRPRSLRRR